MGGGQERGWVDVVVVGEAATIQCELFSERA